MKEKGIAPVVVIAVIIVAAAVAVGAYLLLGGTGGALGGTPLYPGATEFQYEGMSLEQILTEVGTPLPQGWSAKMYQTTANSATVTNWYKSNMPGWTKLYENEMTISSDFVMCYLGFTKASDATFVIAMDVPQGHYLIIMNGPASSMEEMWAGNW